MGQFCVVEHQPVAHFLVKQGGIGEEQVFVVVNETFLDATVKSFTVRVHFRRLGVGFPVR
jgi:hypothetical protein